MFNLTTRVGSRANLFYETGVAGMGGRSIPS
jgi:hypothetical protein